MIAERYWEHQKNDVLAQLKDADNGDAILAAFRQFWEGLKVHVLSAYGHEATLRQQIALLFKEAGSAAEFLLIREEPRLVVVQPQASTEQKLPDLLRSPLLIYAISAFGICLSMVASGNAWQYALLFGAIAGCEFYLTQKAGPSHQPQFEVKAVVNAELFEKYMTRQVQMIDAHIADLQTLHNEVLQPMGNVIMDKTSISLCQYVWASAKQGYPVESTLMMAEKLMTESDMEWVTYQVDTRHLFDVMPTKRASRMVYPALRKSSDGTLICKGQYLKSNEEKPE